MAEDPETLFPDYVPSGQFADEASAIQEADSLRARGVDAQVVPVWPRGYAVILPKELVDAYQHNLEVVPPESFLVRRIRRASLVSLLYGVPLHATFLLAGGATQFADRLADNLLTGFV